MTTDTLAEYAATVMQRCALLGSYSEEAERLTRPFASQSMRQVNEVVGEWMQAAGMSVRHDAVGNLIGRYEPAQPDSTEPRRCCSAHISIQYVMQANMTEYLASWSR